MALQIVNGSELYWRYNLMVVDFSIDKHLKPEYYARVTSTLRDSAFKSSRRYGFSILTLTNGVEFVDETDARPLIVGLHKAVVQEAEKMHRLARNIIIVPTKPEGSKDYICLKLNRDNYFCWDLITDEQLNKSQQPLFASFLNLTPIL